MLQQPSSAKNSQTKTENIFFETAKQHLINGNKTFAISECLQACQKFPKSVKLGIFLSQLYQQNTQFDDMLTSIKRLSLIYPNDPLVNIRKSECQIYASEMAGAITTLDQLFNLAGNNLQILAKLAELYLHCAQHQKANICHEKCLTLQPDNPAYLYNLSFSKLTHGKIEAAETLIKKTIVINPNDFDAYYSQSTLKKVTKTNNHIKQLKTVLDSHKNNAKAEIPLKYALAKELEDIGDYTAAFNAIKRAADLRKQGMQYQVKTDVEAMTTIRKNFNASIINESSKQKNIQQNSPIFILGLPRSGTTLVEKILSAHSKVESLGEINCLAYSIMHCVGPHQDKLDLIKRSSEMDYQCLAEKYLNATQGFNVEADYLIDKTPLNFLYIGLIKSAFPNAKIIHLKRHPLDSCFAMYKTLFRMGYPFSYSLKDLGDYYIAYHQLMGHWKSIYRDEIYQCDYQTLVSQPETQIKRLLDYCGLDWQENIMNFHQNTSTSATASAAQVRKPIYQSSVNRWKSYQQQLQPLKKQLQEQGISFDE